MINYFVINEDGLITKKGSCSFETDLPKSENIFFGECPIEATHYINNEFVTIVDEKKIENEVLRLRDIYLNNGPDRISPIWYNAMTDAQKQEWAQYRQDLLDITQQPDYPNVIIWPEKPSEGA